MSKKTNSDTISILQAAQRLGIGRNLAYAAAASGELPAIRIGRTLRVPVRRLERLLGLEPLAQPDVPTPDSGDLHRLVVRRDRDADTPRAETEAKAARPRRGRAAQREGEGNEQ